MIVLMGKVMALRAQKAGDMFCPISAKRLQDAAHQSPHGRVADDVGCILYGRSEAYP
jgi:hypothetical protein